MLHVTDLDVARVQRGLSNTACNGGREFITQENQSKQLWLDARIGPYKEARDWGEKQMSGSLDTRIRFILLLCVFKIDSCYLNQVPTLER